MTIAASVLDGVRTRRRRVAGNTVVVWVCAAIVGLALLLAVFGPALAPHDPDAADLTYANVGPVAGHPLGFDSQGRDLLSRLLAGARTSMAGPALVVVLAMAGGTVLAVVSAWAGRWIDATLSAVMDVLFAFPAVLLAVLAAAVFGPGLTAPTLVLALAYTPYVARVLRGAALRERAQPYIAACEVQGLSAFTICLRHLVPNIAPMMAAQGTLLFGYAMVDFAAISFMGLGVQPPTSDWGVMVSTGQPGVLQGYPAESLTAGLCIVVVVVAVNLLGERLSQRSEGR
ncbi:ABC transporter permease [Streptomyces spongiae]|uniref:ABC transporter permease n=1 Tax=Streptomyces spongiae TaxID=565072 RepID=A0A5N8XAR1_9ACTN|nr:ABC transporter permease [Streptomyces spongiae]MPY56549.1 ABC transporter permease [Streptomyces spongiae]